MGLGKVATIPSLVELSSAAIPIAAHITLLGDAKSIGELAKAHMVRVILGKLDRW